MPGDGEQGPGIVEDAEGWLLLRATLEMKPQRLPRDLGADQVGQGTEARRIIATADPAGGDLPDLRATALDRDDAQWLERQIGLLVVTTPQPFEPVFQVLDEARRELGPGHAVAIVSGRPAEKVFGTTRDRGRDRLVPAVPGPIDHAPG